MPAYYDEEEGYGGGRRSGLGAMARFGGLAAVIVVMAGGAMMLLDSGPRDADEVPLIRADAGPVKTQATSQDGAGARHADVTAFEVAEGGVTGGTQGLSAPAGQPADEDLPMSKIAAVTTVGAGFAGGEPGVIGARPTGLGGAAPRPASGAVRDQQVAALSLDDGGYAVPDALTPPRVQRLITSEAELLQTRRPVRIVSDQDGPVPPRGEGSPVAPPVSPFARSRPDDLSQRFAHAGSAAVEAQNELIRAAEQSQFQIQLGAYPERSTIELEWSRLSQANNDVLSGRALAVQQTVSGGTTYYRLRVGPFRDGLEASTVCQALKARGYDCLVAINTESRG
ncbi:MAG: SPOR domain-containing protein [Pseudomonadota bacterium]